MADPLDSPPSASIDPTQESTGPEIVSREIDPVLFIPLHTADDFLPRPCSNGTLGNRHVSCAVNNYLVKLVLSASLSVSAAAGKIGHVDGVHHGDQP